MGEFTEAGPGGPAPGAAPGAAPGGGAPDLTAAAQALGISNEELQNALGGPPPDVAAAAEVLGMTEADLRAVLAANGVAPPAD